MLLDTIRTPPRGTWAGDHGLDKHSRQRFMVPESITTQRPSSACSLLPLPVVAGQRQSARSPPPVMAVAHGRSQSLRCACGSDRIGAAVSSRLEPCGKANGILYFIPSCVKEKRITLASIV